MGTPLPENPIGVASTVCWGPGKLFGDNGTPHILTVHFTDWIEGGQFFESYRQELATPKQLYQTANPLLWTAESTGWLWSVNFAAISTSCRILKKPLNVQAFRNLNAPLCAVVVPNTLVVEHLAIALDGFLNITFSEVFT